MPSGGFSMLPRFALCLQGSDSCTLYFSASYLAGFTWMWPIGATSGRLDGRRKWEARVLSPFSVLDSNSSSSYTSSINRPAMVSASGQRPVTPPFPLSFQSRVLAASFCSYPLGCLSSLWLSACLSPVSPIPGFEIPLMKAQVASSSWLDYRNKRHDGAPCFPDWPELWGGFSSTTTGRRW